MKKLFKENRIATLSVIVFLAIWQIVALYEIINPLYIGVPSEIFLEFVAFFTTNPIYEDLFMSMSALVIGFSVAIIMGITIGLLVGIYKNLYKILSPYIFSLYVLPPIAIMPLIIIWFGIGFEAKITIIILMTFVPILIATADGVKGIDKRYLDMASSFGASDFYILKRVALPFALPSIFSGIRIAAGRAVIGMVIAEFLGIGMGVGYLISFYGATLQTNRLMATLLYLLIFNYILLFVIEKIRKRVLFWQNV